MRVSWRHSSLSTVSLTPNPMRLNGEPGRRPHRARHYRRALLEGHRTLSERETSGGLSQSEYGRDVSPSLPHSGTRRLGYDGLNAGTALSNSIGWLATKTVAPDTIRGKGCKLTSTLLSASGNFTTRCAGAIKCFVMWEILTAVGMESGFALHSYRPPRSERSMCSARTCIR